MTTNYAQAAKKFGTLEHGAKTLALAQQAYPENASTGGVEYRAAAVDDEGNDYIVIWPTTAAWDAAEAAYKADPVNNPPNEDESMACDWTAPSEIRAI